MRDHAAHLQEVVPAENGHFDVLHELVQAKAGVGMVRTDTGATPAFTAAQHGHTTRPGPTMAQRPLRTATPTCCR